VRLRCFKTESSACTNSRQHSYSIFVGPNQCKTLFSLLLNGKQAATSIQLENHCERWTGGYLISGRSHLPQDDPVDKSHVVF